MNNNVLNYSIIKKNIFKKTNIQEIKNIFTFTKN